MSSFFTLHCSDYQLLNRYSFELVILTSEVTFKAIFLPSYDHFIFLTFMTFSFFRFSCACLYVFLFNGTLGLHKIGLIRSVICVLISFAQRPVRISNDLSRGTGRIRLVVATRSLTTNQLCLYRRGSLPGRLVAPLSTVLPSCVQSAEKLLELSMFLRYVNRVSTVHHYLLFMTRNGCSSVIAVEVCAKFTDVTR